MKNLLKLLTFFVITITHINLAKASIKAVIFDCDGVLVESESLKYKAWKETLADKGISLSQAEYQALAGLPGRYILKKLSAGKNKTLSPSIIEEKNALYKSLQQTSIQPIDDTLQAFYLVKQQGLKVAVASSASMQELQRNLQHLHIYDECQEIVSGKDDLSHYVDKEGVNKPRPYIYLETAHRLGFSTSECIVIEDSEAGIVAAKTAGCKVIAIATFWTKNQKLHLADIVLDKSNTQNIMQAISNLIEQST